MLLRIFHRNSHFLIRHNNSHVHHNRASLEHDTYAWKPSATTIFRDCRIKALTPAELDTSLTITLKRPCTTERYFLNHDTNAALSRITQFLMITRTSLESLANPQVRFPRTDLPHCQCQGRIQALSFILKGAVSAPFMRTGIRNAIHWRRDSGNSWYRSSRAGQDFLQSHCTPWRSDLRPSAILQTLFLRPDNQSVSDVTSHFNDCAQDPIVWLVSRRLGINAQHPLTNLASCSCKWDHFLKSPILQFKAPQNSPLQVDSRYINSVSKLQGQRPCSPTLKIFTTLMNRKRTSQTPELIPRRLRVSSLCSITSAIY